MTDSTHNVHVNLGARSYDITIDSGNLPSVGAMLAEMKDVSHVVLVTDTNVDPLYAPVVAKGLKEASLRVTPLVIQAGEPSKSIGVVERLWNEMLDDRTDRRSVVVALGGGVVGDLAGFLAATFVRGLRFLQVPTTLLAQVDSSVGGKVGINLPGGKNMVGAFLQPGAVLIDTATLDTLPEREYRAGLAEVVKYGVILDAGLFRLLEENTRAVASREHEIMSKVIQRCCRLKADVVEADEHELGLRAILNYGHTFGHPIETLCGYGVVLHGEAVAMGMRAAAAMAVNLGMFDAESAGRQQRLLDALGLETTAPAMDPDAAIDVMMHDKKVRHGKLRVVLPREIGKVEVVDNVDPKDVLAALVG